MTPTWMSAISERRDRDDAEEHLSSRSQRARPGGLPPPPRACS